MGWGGVTPPSLSRVCSEGRLGFLCQSPSCFLGLYFPQNIAFIHEVIHSFIQSIFELLYSVPGLTLLIR